MYVTHHRRKCIVVFYRNKIHFEPIHKSNGKTLKLERCVVKNLDYSFKNFPEKQTIEKINQSKKQYEQYLIQKSGKHKERKRTMKKFTKNLIKVSGVIMASLTVGELTQPVLASSTSNLRTERSAKKASSSSMRQTIEGPYTMNLEQDSKTPNSSVRSTNTVMYYITTKDNVWYYGCLKNNKLVIVPFGITKHDGHECIAAYYQGKTHYRRINTKTESLSVSAGGKDLSLSAGKISPNYQVKKIDEKYARNQIQKSQVKDQEQASQKAAKEQASQKSYAETLAKKEPLYQYLAQHQNQQVQKITVVQGNPNQTDALYLVGNQAQITQAVNDLNNYHPDNSITILPNKSGVKIFNDRWEAVNDPNKLYQKGEKISIDPHVLSATDMQNQIKQNEFDTQFGKDAHHLG